MDVALAIELAVPKAKYGGSTTSNTKEQYNALRWEDERKKPTWEELEQAWLNYTPKVEVTLEDRVKKLETDTKAVDARVKAIEAKEAK
jgi:hypothetical protein